MVKSYRNKLILIAGFMVLLTVFSPVIYVASGSFVGDDYDSVAAIFKLGMGARPMGMGGAFTGLSDDENAVFYNPAALGFHDRSGITSLWSPRFGIIDYGGLGFSTRYLGLNVTLLSSGPIDIPNEFGSDTGDSFTYLSSGGVGGFGLPISDNISIGGRLKYYYSNITGGSGGTAFAWSVDPGLFFRLGGFGLGVILENQLSSGLSYGGSREEQLPKTIRAGIAYSMELTDRMLLRLLSDFEAEFSDVSDFSSYNITPHAGAELWIDILGLRVGYNGVGLTVGSSLDLNFVGVDWGYEIYPDNLPGTHMISLAYRF